MMFPLFFGGRTHHGAKLVVTSYVRPLSPGFVADLHQTFRRPLGAEWANGRVKLVATK